MYNLKAILGLLVSSLLLIGCADLTETMRSDITDQYYDTPEGFQDLLLTPYWSLHQIYPFPSGNIATNVGVDNFSYGTGARAFNNTYDAGLNPTAASRGWGDVWDYSYEGINHANAIVDRAAALEGVSEEDRNSWMAEGRFLRAHFYHWLVQQFGPVHLTLEETTGVETEAERAPEEEVWAAIIEDLEFAAEHLPETQDMVGRPQANAAKHHLARAHLTIENWEEAAYWAAEVIESGQHRLLDSYAEVWDPYATSIGDKNDETIWGINHTADNAYDQVSREFAPRVRTLAGVQATGFIGQESSRYKPTEFFVTEIFNNDPERTDVPNHWNDERYRTGFKEVWRYNHPGSLPSGAAVGDTAAWFPAAKEYQELSDEEAEQLSEECNCLFLRIQDWTDEHWTGMAYKFRHRGDDSPEQSLAVLGWYGGDWGRTIPIFRLAETYLIAAEAHMMMGNQGEAANYFNAVRSRAEAPGEEIPLISPGELDIDEILDERARELAGEYLRYHDLKRTGKFLERIRAHNPEAAPNVQEHHMRRPIPQSQIDHTSNDYPQNPGY